MSILSYQTNCSQEANIYIKFCSMQRKGPFYAQINKFGRPTWRRLVDAVEDHEGGNNRVLAETIAQNHPGW